jgi:hypothetical protein
MNRSVSLSRRARSKSALTRIALAGLLGLAWQMTGCSTAPRARSEPASVESTYGIHVEGLRLSAAGSMLDFRYRVVDPDKAMPVLDGKVQPYLFDGLRGAKLGVPESPVMGRMRQTSRNRLIKTDHTYFIMFGNPGKAVKSGDKVTLLMGQLKITDLTVR